jgi:uracil-DNA glycosylase family 4
MHDSKLKAEALARISDRILEAGITPHLRSTATQLVFGTGSPDADIVFIGEAPGAKEDLTGEPFVGAAGKFLNVLLASIGLEREDIYITNIVKYRPPENRDPSKQEIEDFKPYLLEQIEVIRPKVVAFLGRHSMSVYLPDLKIGDVHGQAIYRDGLVYLPLYHPAAALYNPAMRQQLLDDFAGIPALINAH